MVCVVGSGVDNAWEFLVILCDSTVVTVSSAVVTASMIHVWSQGASIAVAAILTRRGCGV